MKLKHVMIMVLVALMVLLFPKISNAASSVVLEEIEVITEEGTYETGDIIEFKAKFSGNVVGDEGDAALIIKFGESEYYGEHYINNEGTISGNTITFQHTIEETDSGELSLQGFSAYLDDENGEYVSIEEPTEFIGGTITANPIKWTDASEANFEIIVNDTDYSLKSSNITQLRGHSYYVFFTNSEQEPEVTLNDRGRIDNADKVLDEKINIEPILELNGDISVWIYEEQMNYENGNYEQRAIVEKYKVERPAQRKLGQRIRVYFFDDRTSTYLWEPHDSANEENRKINIKLGKVENTAILNSIKNNEAGALGQLLEYAKNSNATYTTTIALGVDEGLTSKMGLVDEAYYYIYLEMEDEDGKYYPIEDIDLGQAYQQYDGSWFIYGYTDTNFAWKDDGDEFSDFTNAKVTIGELLFEGDTTNPDSFKERLTLKIYNVISNLSVKHQFYYYVSNSKTDVPDVSSNLWTKVESFAIDANTGACEINTTDITKLSYFSDLNLDSDIYVYVYEVIGSEPITSETISGNYRLVLNAETLSWEEKDDTVIKDPEIPQTGATPEGIIIAVIVIAIFVTTVVKMKKYRDIK